MAASLLASPIAWHNYLVLLAPGVLLLLARGWTAPALLLLALQAIPAQWILLWNEDGTIGATFALTLYLFVLLAHWIVLLLAAQWPLLWNQEPSVAATLALTLYLFVLLAHWVALLAAVEPALEKAG